MGSTLYYGDNLKVLKEYLKDESVDLIYLDPPFNSNRSYNVLFKDEFGSSSDAQISVFDDSWHWGDNAQLTFEDLLLNASSNVSSMINSLHQFIGTNQMMAYLVMMAARLVELHRVLKSTGSLYLHCDSTASHYIKILLDAIFGLDQYRNEIIWERFGSHNDPKRFGKVTDSILFYSKTNSYLFNPIRIEYSNDHLTKRFRYSDPDGRLFWPNTMLAPGGRGPEYEWNGFTRNWRFTKDNMQKLHDNGEIYYSEKGFPYRKNYLDKLKGQLAQNLWKDIKMTKSGAERLGYPTQKPLALLERIINASSNPNGVVLDPFSGCGTCITAAQKLGRKWIGIDITHLAIAMHKLRLKTAFGLEPNKDYQVIGEPEDLAGAQQLSKEDRYQFQWWALSLIEARPVNGEGKKEKKGFDRGIDGFINFLDRTGLMKAVVQVKSGHVNSSHIRDLKGTLEREKAPIGIFITLESPSREMITEAVSAGSFHSVIWNKDYPRIQILTIDELLSGVEVKIPPTPNDATAFKRAEKVKKEGPNQEELGI